VVFVVSAQSVGRGWTNQEFAAAIAKAAAGQRRLIPVIYGDVALPEFVASRFYIDFRNLDSPAAYEAKVRELAAAIRGRPRGARPRPGGGRDAHSACAGRSRPGPVLPGRPGGPGAGRRDGRRDRGRHGSPAGGGCTGCAAGRAALGGPGTARSDGASGAPRSSGDVPGRGTGASALGDSGAWATADPRRDRQSRYRRRGTARLRGRAVRDRQRGEPGTPRRGRFRGGAQLGQPGRYSLRAAGSALPRAS
jgi:TIR domain-containing protein